MLAVGRADSLAWAVDQPRTEIEVMVFEGGEGLSFFQNAAAEYEKLRPDIKVNLYGDPRIADKVRVRVLESTYPEITNAGLNYWPLIHHGDVLPLNEFLSGPNWENDGTWRSSFVTGSLAPFTENGQSFGLPFSMFVNVIWYNPDLFRQHGWKPPATWTEFFTLCDQMKAAGVQPLGFQGRYPYYAEPIFASVYYHLAGLDSYNDFRHLKPGSFDNATTVAALETTRKFATFFQPGAMGMSHTEAQMQFLLGNVAMLPCGAWLKSEMMGKIPDGFHFASFNLPSIGGANDVGDPTAMNAFASFYYVMKGSKHPREAVDFLRFMTSRKMARAFSRERDIPTAVRDTSNGNLSADLRGVASVIEQAKVNYGNAGEDLFVLFPEMAQHWDDTFAQVLAGKISPAEAARSLEAAAAAVRAKAEDPSQITVRYVWQPVLLGAIIVLGLTYLAVRLWKDLAARRLAGRKVAAELGSLSIPNFLRFVAPALVIYFAFVVLPSLRAFSWSLHTWDGLGGIGTMTWAGLLHFKRLLFERDAFWIALNNNIFLMVVIPLCVVPLALALAACLSRGIFGAGLFRVVFFFPNLLGGVAVSLLWMHLYNPQGGLINALLVKIGLTSFNGFAWLSADHLYWALIPMSVWGACGFNIVLYLAAMQGVPDELYEAADLEGASPWRQFWAITLPMIWDVVIVSFVFLFIGGMKAFDVIWLLTNQRPSTANHVVGTRVVQTMFSEFNVGEATAMAVVLFILVFICTGISMRFMRREAVEG